MRGIILLTIVLVIITVACGTSDVARVRLLFVLNIPSAESALQIQLTAKILPDAKDVNCAQRAKAAVPPTP